MKKKQPTKDEIMTAMFDALTCLVVRFPLEGLAQPSALGDCKCNQYQDHGDCRHMMAIRALEMADGKIK